MAKSLLAGAPSKVPGAPPSVPGRQALPGIVGGLYTRVPHQPTSGMFAGAHFQQLRDVHGHFAGGFGFSWTGLEATGKALKEYNGKSHRGIKAAAERIAKEMLEYAKTNAPWEDRTGEARAGLQSAVIVEPDGEHISIFLGYGDETYYGVWLEVMQGGKFAIIGPTINKFQPTIGAEIRTQV